MGIFKKKVTDVPEEQTLDEIVHDENNFEDKGEKEMSKKSGLKKLGIGAAGYGIYKLCNKESYGDVSLDEFEELFDEEVEPEGTEDQDEAETDAE